MMDTTQQPDGGNSTRTGFGAILETMRVSHWVKNAFVAAPILFSQKFDRPEAWWPCLAAVGAFCLLSSGIYFINDVFDRGSDRAHPVKRLRPVASGRLSATAAMIAGLALLATGMGIAAAVSIRGAHLELPLRGAGLVIWAGAYVVLNLLYSVWLKSRVIVDVLVVALGFVLRAMAGAAAIAVLISPWLVLCTFTLCLFIALTKRRSEIAELPAESAAETRRVNRAYTQRDLDHMLTVSTAMAILTYSLYCLAPGTVKRFGSAHMVWTIPLVIYGMFRYSLLTRQAGGGDPVTVVLRDRVMWLVMVAYVLLTVAVIRVGSDPAVNIFLDDSLPK